MWIQICENKKIRRRTRRRKCKLEDWVENRDNNLVGLINLESLRFDDRVGA